MIVKLYHDIAEGTEIVFVPAPAGASELRITVATVPFSQHTMQLDLDDIDRLLAVREASHTPVMDISEFFQDVHHAQRSAADRAARAFVAVAGSLAETVR